jgi:hypothetical protein
MEWQTHPYNDPPIKDKVLAKIAGYNKQLDLSIELFEDIKCPSPEMFGDWGGIMPIQNESSKSNCLVCGKLSLTIICTVCTARLNREVLHDVILDVKDGKKHTPSH